MRNPTDNRRVSIWCPAKVNLALSVGSPRSDGLHPIASWMVAVSFADQLMLEQIDAGPSRFHLGFVDAPGGVSRDDGLLYPGGQTVDWPLEKDIAYRAHRVLESHIGASLPIRAALQKCIPPGAGLGGGSSDGAAMLVGLNQLFHLELGTPTLIQLAQQLGSDVGFLVSALAGESSALVTGIGERLEPLPLGEVVYLTLIFPDFGCPTGEVYRAFDQLRGVSEGHRFVPDESRVRGIATPLPLPEDAPFNDLAEPACLVRPRLKQIQGQLAVGLQVPVHITGSGSTLFLIAPSAIAGEGLARQATALTGLPAIATRTLQAW
jgi:4-diphosphocytidyl-2C-methyl-D-erythritol kinase